MVDLNKIGIRVSSLTNQIVVARFGRDPSLALDTRNAENEFFQALCSYAFDHKMPEPGHGGVVQFGSGDEQFTAMVRRFTSKEEADRDTVIRNAAPELLEALDNVVTACFHYTGEDQEDYVQHSYDAALAAIKKAKGE